MGGVGSHQGGELSQAAHVGTQVLRSRAQLFGACVQLALSCCWPTRSLSP